MVHSVSGWTRSVQVKLWDPLRTRAIPERLRGVFTTRRHTNPCLPYLTYLIESTDDNDDDESDDDDAVQVRWRRWWVCRRTCRRPGARRHLRCLYSVWSTMRDCWSGVTHQLSTVWGASLNFVSGLASHPGEWFTCVTSHRWVIHLCDVTLIYLVSFSPWQVSWRACLSSGVTRIDVTRHGNWWVSPYFFFKKSDYLFIHRLWKWWPYLARHSHLPMSFIQSSF